MPDIPLPTDTDSEDVVWALQTADTLWRRGERIDALVWLRRGAQAAGDNNDDDRAFELARFAAELTDFMNAEVDAAPPESVPVPVDQGDDGIEELDADELSDDDLIVDEDVEEAGASGATAPPPPAPRKKAPSVPEASEVH